MKCTYLKIATLQSKNVNITLYVFISNVRNFSSLYYAVAVEMQISPMWDEKGVLKANKNMLKHEIECSHIATQL